MRHMWKALLAGLMLMVCLWAPAAVLASEWKTVDCGTLATDGKYIDVPRGEDTVFRYRLDLKSQGKLSFDAEEKPGSEGLFNVYLRDADEMTVGETYTEHFIAADNTHSWNPIYLLKGTYYLEVKPNKAAVKLRASFTAVPTAEQEPNNERAEAIPMALNQKVTGFLTKELDNRASAVRDNEDWYTFTLTKKDGIALDLHFEEYTGRAIIYDRELRVMKTVYKMKHTDGIADDPVSLPAGTYYVKVDAWDIGIGGRYSLTVESENAKKVPKVTGVKAKAGKKKITVTWKKRSGVNGYQVYVSTKKSGGFRKAAAIKSAGTKKAVVKKYGSKKLSSGRTYYVKVRAYKKLNGKTYTGAWSAVKKVRVK